MNQLAEPAQSKVRQWRLFSPRTSRVRCFTTRTSLSPLWWRLNYSAPYTNAKTLRYSVFK